MGSKVGPYLRFDLSCVNMRKANVSETKCLQKRRHLHELTRGSDSLDTEGTVLAALGRDGGRKQADVDLKCVRRLGKR